MKRALPLVQKARRVLGVKGFSEPPFWSLDRLSQRLLTSTPWGDHESVEHNLQGYIQHAYKEDGVVFACVQTRQWLLSMAQFGWMQLNDGRAGRLTRTPELSILQRPWPGGTIGELICRMESMASLAGNFYGVLVDDRGNVGRGATGPGRRIVSLRPDWVDIIITSSSGSPHSLDARIGGYKYTPRGQNGSEEPTILSPDEVVHFAPSPDPAARFRGMSWLTPILREIEADKAATLHKARFFSNGATPSVMVSLKDVNAGEFDEFVRSFEASHRGSDNAYKTLFLMGGADVNVVGADLHQLDFKASIGVGETRIANAAGIHPVILGLSEGLGGSSLNVGNFNAARRLTADKTLHPLWRMMAASLERLFTVPDDTTVLWPDLRFSPFNRDDAKDEAEIALIQARTLRQLLDGGYTHQSAIAALTTQDWSQLEHTGLFTVQLQPPQLTGSDDGLDDEDQEI